MLLSLNLLKKYVDLPRGVTLEDLKSRLTKSTVEVERVFFTDKKEDAIIDIDNKSLTNRPDLWSHYGIARELSVIYQRELKPLEIDKRKFDSDKKRQLRISILQKNLCLRYLGARIENINIEESPDWLKKELTAVGVKPINNIVDITNYVLLETGQPLHAFDANLVFQNSRGGIEIIVRTAQKGEKIVLLDGNEKKLDETMLVIADTKKPIAVAGIMGGAETGVNDQTTSIILEAATFEAVNVRRTSQKLDLKTESSVRFEKALHPNLAEIGIRRALKLILALIPGAEVIEVVDKNLFKPKVVVINTTYSFLEKKIGQKITKKEVDNILQRLSFKIERQSDEEKLRLEVPWWRSTGDISIPEDIVEEVARIYGYDNLQEKEELVNLQKSKYQPEFDLELKVKNYLAVGWGMNEVFNYPWAEAAILAKLGIKSGMIEIANPPTEENRFLQATLIPNLIKNAEKNLGFFHSFKLFELARVYQVGVGKFDGIDVLPKQPKMLAGVFVGTRSQDVFLEAKGMIEQLVSFLQIGAVGFEPKTKVDFLNPGKCLQVVLNKEPLGYLGAIKKEIYQKFDFRNKEVVVFEIDFEKLVCAYESVLPPRYNPLPEYPPVVRDFAIEVEYAVTWKQILDNVQRVSRLIREITFLSVYDLKDGRKSVAFRVVFQSDEKTLKSEEVKEIEEKIVRLLGENLGARLRT